MSSVPVIASPELQAIGWRDHGFRGPLGAIGADTDPLVAGRMPAQVTDVAPMPDVDTMLAWAQSMTWKGCSPLVELTHKEYPRGVTLNKQAMRAVEDRLERHPELPKWDILIRPTAPD